MRIDNHVFDLDQESDALELFAEEVTTSQHAWSDCASSVFSASSATSCGGTLSSVGSIISCGS